ncbi:MAG: lysophospholipid acyltransferase family protein [Candidatus Sumerlaeia bacterium]|nr:lysophospholipid acyltransferase family protein [Candidatus Sumerlaeia bacterium]
MAAHHTPSARLISWAALTMIFAVTRLPMRWAVALGGGAGWLCSHVCPLRRGLVLRNLAIAFPGQSEAERRRLMRRCYRNFGRWAFETCFAGRVDTVKAGLVVEEEHRERLDRMLAECPGFIAVTGHLGSWEIGATHFAYMGIRLTAVVKPLHNGYMNDHIVRSRRRSGLKILFTNEGLTTAVTGRINRDEVVVIVSDQDARQAGTFVEFFGRPTSTPRGVAMFSVRSGRPILPVFTTRVRGNRHRMHYGEPIWPRDGEDIDQEVRRITQAYTRELEALVRRFPDQYFWFHDRWKTSPGMLKPKRLRRAGLASAQEVDTPEASPES